MSLLRTLTLLFKDNENNGEKPLKQKSEVK